MKLENVTLNLELTQSQVKSAYDELSYHAQKSLASEILDDADDDDIAEAVLEYNSRIDQMAAIITKDQLTTFYNALADSDVNILKDLIGVNQEIDTDTLIERAIVKENLEKIAQNLDEDQVRILLNNVDRDTVMKALYIDSTKYYAEEITRSEIVEDVVSMLNLDEVIKGIAKWPLSKIIESVKKLFIQ